MQRDRKISFKKLAHVNAGAGKSKIFEAGQRTRNSRSTRCCILSSEAVWMQNSSLLRELQSFLLRPSTNWVSPTRIMDRNQLYSKYTDIMLIVSLKTMFTATTALLFKQTMGYCSLAKLIGEITIARTIWQVTFVLCKFEGILILFTSTCVCWAFWLFIFGPYPPKNAAF